MVFQLFFQIEVLLVKVIYELNGRLQPLVDTDSQYVLGVGPNEEGLALRNVVHASQFVIPLNLLHDRLVLILPRDDRLVIGA